MPYFIMALIALITFNAPPAAAHGDGKGMLRHQYFMENGIPDSYKNIKSDVAPSPSQGASVYKENCMACHDADGTGKGEAGLELDPPPADLLMMAKMPMMKDNFFYWAIAEGGELIGTDMPAFKETLSKQEIWNVISYIRAGLKE